MGDGSSASRFVRQSARDLSKLEALQKETPCPCQFRAKLRARDWAYANGNLGKSALSSMMDVFALFYLTTALNVSAVLAGAIVLVSMIWDSLTDPLIGYWADHHRSAQQTAVRYFAFGGPVAASAFLLFYMAQFFPQDLRIVAAVTGLLVFRAGYALVDVPHNGLFPAIASSKRAKTDISGMRILFSALGKLSVTALAAGLPNAQPLRCSTHRAIELDQRISLSFC